MIDETIDDSAADSSATEGNWWRRLTGGLKRTSSALGGAITDVVSKRLLDVSTLSEIQDLLVRADLGFEPAAKITTALSEGRFNKAISPDEVKIVVAAEIEKVLAPVAQPLMIDAAKKPFVILVAGVNGSGKTTTIGKLAAKLRAERRTVVMAAGDTFRAAAVEQLKIWGQRTGATVIAREVWRGRGGPGVRRRHRGEGARRGRPAGRYRGPPAKPRRAHE